MRAISTLAWPPPALDMDCVTAVESHVAEDFQDRIYVNVILKIGPFGPSPAISKSA